MKLGITLIICFCCTTLMAQEKILDIAKSNRLSNLSINLQMPKNIDNMPIGKVGDVNQTFSFNNGQGLNLYKSQPDNMPVAKPDGSLQDNMCSSSTNTSKLLELLSKTQENGFKPKGNSKYNFVMPAYQDSLPHLDSTKKLFK